MSDPRRDVIVVGAGPVGLSLALGLARDGRSVLVLEKEDGLSEHSRAPIIWPRTQEVLAGLGVMDRFQETGIVRSRIQLWDVDRERPLLHVPIEELRGETPFPQLLICPQSTTERLLLDGLRQETSAAVRFSAEVAGVRQGEGGVEVDYEHDGTTQTVTGAFVAGCDGAHSRVREAVVTSFEGMTYRMQAALADISFETSQDVRYPRMTRRRGVATGIRIDERRWRVIMPRTPEDTTPLDARIEQAVTDLFPTRRYETIWKSEFNLHRRLAEPFVDGRIALAGDAAHLTSPVGGQGVNVGIQDANALGRALGQALDRDDSSPLARYEAERREALEGGAVWVTDTLTRILLAREGAFLVPALKVLGMLLRVDPLRRLVLRRMALLDDPSRRA
jgi:2-polyprenyl-6-methoxyphenol hydroxylase-like FAD-dependent oxidoreductase